MGIDAEACATGLLVALDAAMCLGVGAMLTELAAEFGTGESYAAALVATPFYAGRLVATLMVPDALSRHGRRSVLGTGALALAVSAAWFSRAASLEECAFARLACGLAAGPAPIAALSLPARRLSATGAPLALQLVTLSAVVGALGAQAPLQLAVRVLGWRRATLLGCALPALVVALGAAIFRDEPPASGRNPLLLRWPSRRARSDSNTSFTMGLGDAARRSFDESPACCIPRALLPASSEPHLRLFAASCGAAHALLDSLGGPLGLLAMQRGLAPYDWSADEAIWATSTVQAAALVVLAFFALQTHERTPDWSAHISSVLCAIGTAALALLALLPTGRPPPAAAAGCALLCVATAGAVGAAPLLLWQVVLVSSTAAQRLASSAALGVAYALAGGALTASLPLLLPDHGARPARALGAAGVLVALGLCTAGCSALLARLMRTAEMSERVMILSLENGDAFDESASDLSFVGSGSGVFRKVADGWGGGGAPRVLSVPGGARPPLVAESACDVRQRGSLESLARLMMRWHAPSTPPRPYAAENLLRAQIASGLAPLPPAHCG